MIYNVCDVMNIMHLISQTLRVVVIKCGYDVKYKAYDGIHMRPVMTYTARVMSSTERV